MYPPWRRVTKQLLLFPTALVSRAVKTGRLSSGTTCLDTRETECFPEGFLPAPFCLSSVLEFSTLRPSVAVWRLTASLMLLVCEIQAEQTSLMQTSRLKCSKIWNLLSSDLIRDIYPVSLRLQENIEYSVHFLRNVQISIVLGLGRDLHAKMQGYIMCPLRTDCNEHAEPGNCGWSQLPLRRVPAPYLLSSQT